MKVLGLSKFFIKFVLIFLFGQFQKFVILCYTFTFWITTNMLFCKVVLSIFGTNNFSSFEIFDFSIQLYMTAFNPFIDGYFSHV